MPQIKPTSLTQYELTETEELTGRVMHENQLYVMQNELASASEALLALRFDPNHQLEFVQQDAELRGKIVFINYLIQSHFAALTELNEQAAQHKDQ
jgi:hypothetical protein